MSGEKQESPADFIDTKGLLLSAGAGVFLAFAMTASPDYITDDGVVEKEGIVSSVSCSGPRAEQVAKFRASDGYSFDIFVKRCDRYDWNAIGGMSYVSHYHPEDPADPIQVNVGGIIGYEDGVSYNDVLAAILIGFAGSFFSLMIYTRIQRFFRRDRQVSSSFDG